MIIVSQERKDIYNFNNVKSINIVDNEIYITDDILADMGTLIARYKTEERAKEVLQGIVKKYSIYLELKGGPAILQGQMDIQPNIFNIPKVYEMPEE